MLYMRHLTIVNMLQSATWISKAQWDKISLKRDFDYYSNMFSLLKKGFPLCLKVKLQYICRLYMCQCSHYLVDECKAQSNCIQESTFRQSIWCLIWSGSQRSSLCKRGVTSPVNMVIDMVEIFLRQIGNVTCNLVPRGSGTHDDSCWIKCYASWP